MDRPRVASRKVMIGEVGLALLYPASHDGISVKS